MRKYIILLITILLGIAILAACGESAPSTSLDNASNDNNQPYTLLLYENALSGLDDTITKRVGYQIIADENVSVSTVVPNKNVTIFGKTHTLKYIETRKSTVALNNRINYKVKYDIPNDTYFISLDSASGALMSYAYVLAGKDRTYQSEVNDKSSESDFLAYAKKLVSQHSSVEGCQVEITTEIFEYDKEDGNYYPKKRLAGYVNNTENVSDFYAIYHFTFYKMLDGIRRYDTNVIEINNTGEIHRLWFNIQDDLYANYSDIDIDMEQAEKLVKSALSQFIPVGSSIEIVPSVVATNDGVLWLYLETFVEFDGGKSGYTYVIQIAGENNRQ